MDEWGIWRLPVTERHNDNSPAIYGWVKRQPNGKVPQGRQNASFVPDGTLEICGHRVPAMNGWAIFTERGMGAERSARGAGDDGNLMPADGNSFEQPRNQATKTA
jgi:hypothetical protein